MKLILKVWLPLLAVAGVALLGYLLLNWSGMSVTHRFSFIVAILLVVHVLEEEKYPGGFAYMRNVLPGNSDVPDRYPMSPLVAMIVDVVMFIILFLPAIFFPEFLWLALAPMFLAIVEVAMHGGLAIVHWRRRGMAPYTPGLVSAVLWGAVSVSFILYISTQGLATGLDWIWAVLYFVGAMIVGLLVPERFLASKNTRWGFDHHEMLGFYRRYTTVREVFGD